MKNKIVIEVRMCSEKYRTKAMEIAANTCGVESIALEGDNKNQLVVTGEGVDSVKLTRTLRKKIGGAIIVEQVKIEEETAVEVTPPETTTETTVDQCHIQHWCHAPRPAPVLIYDWPHSPNPGGCSIL